MNPKKLCLAVAFLALGWARAGHAEESAPRFDVFEYRVLGNTVLPVREVERAVYAHLGENRSFEDVTAAAASLEQAYRAAGYSTVFVDVPEQDVGEGVVRLRVTEAAVGARRTTGARYFSGPAVEASVPALAPGTVPHFPTVQEQLAVVNRTAADLRVTPVLKSGSSPGTVDVELKVKDALPLIAVAEVNDRYTADTTRTRAGLTLGYDAMFGRPHTFSLMYQTAPERPDDSRVIAATYVARLPETGRALAFYGVDSDSDVATVGVLSVLGKGRIYGTRYVLPLATSEQRSASVTLGLDYKDFDETVLVDADNTLVTPISYLTPSFTYALGRSTDAWRASGSASVRFGVRGLFNSSDEFAAKRYLGRPNFFYLAGDGAFERPLPGRLALALRTAWQYSPDPLVSNEQFALGGMSSVRGYLEAERLGDLGISAGLELLSPPLEPAFDGLLRGLRVLAFVDGGYATLHEPLPDQDDAFDLVSAGLGLRLVALEELQMMLDWAYPLVDSSQTAAGDWRLHFLLRYSL